MLKLREKTINRENLTNKTIKIDIRIKIKKKIKQLLILVLKAQREF